jgi:hypothetical protein
VPEHPGPGHKEDPLMPEPTVRELLLADLDEVLAAVTRALDHIQEVTDQLEPERARSCKSAIAVTRVGVMEIHDRAGARPLDSDDTT